MSGLGSFSVVMKILRELVTLYPELRRKPKAGEGRTEGDAAKASQT